jgi:hypothetical protein
MAHVTRTCKNPACRKQYESRTARSLYCCKQCNTEYHRRNTSKTVTIGRLSVEFQDCEDKALEQLQSIVESCLTDNMRKIINNEQLPQSGEATHDTI